jgi:hypothetical protein
VRMDMNYYSYETLWPRGSFGLIYRAKCSSRILIGGTALKSYAGTRRFTMRAGLEQSDL